MSDELPRGWTSARLAELVAFNPKHPATFTDAAPVTFVPMAAVSEASPNLDTSTTRPLREVRKGYTHFANDDVLFAKITPCMENGKGAVASGLVNGLGCGTTELVVMRSLGAIEPHLLYRFLAQPSVRRAAKENFTGTAGQARVPLSFLEELEIPLPPLAEQRRIVAKLEEVLGKVDASRARLAKIPALLKRFRQSVLAAACSGRLTADWRENRGESDTTKEIIGTNYEVPVTWSSAPLGELAKFIDYRGRTPRKTESGVPLITAKNIRWGYIEREPREYIKREEYDLWMTRGIPRIGDVLITTEAPLGFVASVNITERFVLAQRAICLQFHEQGNEAFALRCMMSPAFQAMLVEQATGTTVNGIKASRLKQLQLLLPPLLEQQEIVRRVEALFALADKIEARFKQAQARVEQLTPALLAKAFRGELVPQDPADEPASMLLERIRQEKGGISDSALQQPAFPEPAPRELKVAEPRVKSRRR